MVDPETRLSTLSLASLAFSGHVLFYFCLFLVFSLAANDGDLYTDNLGPEEIIARVNTNLMPRPLSNKDIIKYFPPEQTLDSTKVVAKQLFEGCLTLDDEDKMILFDENIHNGRNFPSSKKRVMEDKRWPSRTIPYEVVHIGLEELTMKVEHVQSELMENVCLNFRPKVDHDLNWIVFYDGYGCHSDFGKKSLISRSPTFISIGKGCQRDSVIMHLLLHALGILHEQNRMDRDNYINIQLQNIQRDYSSLFEKHLYRTIDNQTHPYDYQSIMHFSKSAFGKNDDDPTMLAKENKALVLGSRTLSQLDIKKVNKLFACPESRWQEWGTWSLCSKPCDVGYRKRIRTCLNGANKCIGKPSELGVCRDAKCLPGLVDTTFEDDWGIWKPRSGNLCNWRRGRTRGNQQLTGPQEDHTTGLGRFAQVQYGEHCQPGTEATMRTNKFRPIHRETCLSFFYYLDGKDAGSLEVLLKDITSAKPTLIWTRQGGDQGSGWHPGAVTIPYMPVSFKLYMIATIGKSNQSDVSVDDIFIDIGKCPEGIEGFTECIDINNVHCKELAESGKCASNEEEMWRDCCSSCEQCLDQDHRCRFWSSHGECEANSDWMLKNCKQSCNVYAKDFQTAIGDVQDVNELAKPDGSEVKEMIKHSKGRSVPHFNTHLVWGDQLFEGCLLLDRKDQELLSKPIDPQTLNKRTYISYEEKLWPSNEIPYEIVSTLSHEKSNALFRNAISAAMKTIGQSSCVKFRPKTESDRNWLNFFTGSGCWSGLGRKFWTNEPTYISLGKGCWKEPIVLHHIFHAMGFFHEQNRPDRDDYVRVNWENIINSKLYKFKRHHLYHEKMFAKDYDFKSIMHFHRFSYTRKPSLMTINANHNPHLVLGGEKLSKLDLERLNKMFCDGKPIVIPEEEEDNRVPSWGEWSSCSRECGIGHRFRREKCNKEYCENLKHEMQACRLKLCSFSKYATNFEGGMNMWSSPKSYSGACVWKLFVSNRGGFTDHTTSHGNFVMVDWRDDGCRKHTTVKLESSKIEKNTRWKCLNFFYYMQGEAVGDLIVRMLYNNGASSEVWTRSGSQGNDWKQGAVSLPLTSYEYQIVFEYKVDSKVAYILLDDIYIDDGKCITGMQS
eukprot:gene16171-17794_t